MTAKLTDKQILDYKKDGVILIKKVFLPWIEKLSKGFQKVLNKPSSHGRENVSKQHGGRFFEDYCNWQRIEEFKDFIFNSPAAEIVSQSTQSNKIQVFHEHIFLKEPGTKKETPWHQDLPYYCVDGNDTGSFWIPLDSVSKDNSLKGQFQPSYWLRRIVPLTLGLGAGQFMLSADMIAARITLPDNDSGIYGAAGMIGRGLVIFTAPLAAVMLPKIIRSKDHEEQNILNHTFSRTAILSIIFCSGCTLAAWITPSITESVPILSLKQKNITNITSLVPYFV